MPIARNAATLLVAALGLSAAPASALQSDRQQPVHIEAGAMHFDNVAQTNVFTGGVVVTKGSITIRADKVVVRQTAAGFDIADADGSSAAPATFDQALDTPPGQPPATIHGSALHLQYDGARNLITLTGQALLERHLGSRLSDSTQGAVITYNEITDVFTVEAGNAGKTPSNPQGRVRVMLSPRTSVGAPPSPASAPHPDLRSAPDLGSR